MENNLKSKMLSDLNGQPGFKLHKDQFLDAVSYGLSLVEQGHLI